LPLHFSHKNTLLQVRFPEITRVERRQGGQNMDCDVMNRFRAIVEQCPAHIRSADCSNFTRDYA
jgi:hypothetical protein